MSDNMEEMLERYRQLAERYAPARAKREYLDEYKKSLLALLMKKYDKAGFSSGVAQEREARADSDYMNLLNDLQTAVHEEEKLRYHIKAVELEIEIWRTQSANQRVERRAYGA